MATSPEEKRPSDKSLLDNLLFGLSLPERTLRSGVSVVGGAVREAAQTLVPQSFQDSKTYTVMVRQMLDYLVEDVGGVAKVSAADADTALAESPSPQQAKDFLARKAVGNFMEMAWLATLHVSPLTVMAVVSDVAYGSKTYLQELAVELKRQGVIDENSTIDHVDDLFEAVAHASGATAGVLDTPPLSVDGLKQTIAQTRQALAGIDPTTVLPQRELERFWEEIRQVATQEGVGMMEVSSAMTLHTLGKVATVGRGALSTVKVAGTLLDRHVLDHYREALEDVRNQGLYATLAKVSQPYLDAVWQNFSSHRPTVTEDLLSGKLLGQALGAARRWLGVSEPPRQT